MVTAFKAWSVAIRPRSLPVAIAPVLVGGSFGYARTGFIYGIALGLVVAASLLMQIVTNLQNDVGYTMRGAEQTGGRTGLPRATAQGWLSVGAVRTAIAATAVLAATIGVLLTAYRGWPVLLIGGLSLLAALAYMGGARPIAYTPLGELTVFLFFGLVAVTGTDWVLTGSVGATTIVAAVATGSLAAAALAVNNHRDADHDRLVGRQTFAVRFGERASSTLFSTLLLVPFALLPAMAWMAHAPSLLLPTLLLPLALGLRRSFTVCPKGVAFNVVLFRTFRLGLWYAVSLSAGAVLSRGFA